MPDYSKVYFHPSSKLIFKDFQYPNYDQAINLCIKLHSSIPFIGIIGWDLVVDHNNEVNIMEWNAGHPNGTFIEAAIGPCFKAFGWENLWKERNM